MPKPHHHDETWSIEGRFQHLIYSPKGAIEGLLIDTAGTPTQFVTDPKEASNMDLLGGLKKGQKIVVEGSEEPPSSKGSAAHFVYRLTRLASVDGVDTEPPDAPAEAKGKIVRFNYARHGEPNGFVLNTGDFVHTKPDGFAALGLQVGDKVHAEGPSRPLVTGSGRAIEAHSVNGVGLGPGR